MYKHMNPRISVWFVYMRQHALRPVLLGLDGDWSLSGVGLVKLLLGMHFFATELGIKFQASGSHA
jgi:hypothetical protein